MRCQSIYLLKVLFTHAKSEFSTLTTPKHQNEGSHLYVTAEHLACSACAEIP